MQFKDKVVVITGGAHGIGRTTKEAFEKEGALVEVIDIAEGDHYIGDIGRKEVIEDFADYVIKNMAGFITGENICIDGGMARQMIYHGEHGWKYEDQ